MVNKDKLLALAAMNNAQWCASVCQANGVAGQFTDQVWYAPGEVPVFYPNIITLKAKCRLETVRPIIQQMGGSLSIKDSFNTLALASLGLVKLFDAQWLLAPAYVQAKGRYQLVTDANQLTQWTAAWCRTPSKSPVNPALLHQASIHFVAIYEEDCLVAGGIINRSEGVVGLTNVFCHTSEARTGWLTCLSAASVIGDGLPVVTYQHGDERTLVKSIGFTEIGPLSVWVKPYHS